MKGKSEHRVVDCLRVLDRLRSNRGRWYNSFEIWKILSAGSPFNVDRKRKRVMRTMRDLERARLVVCQKDDAIARNWRNYWKAV